AVNGRGRPSSHACSSTIANRSNPRSARLAIAEVAVGRGRADARPPRGLGKGETRPSFLCDQFQGGAQQRFFQVAVVIAARTTAPVFPAHVNSFYMSRRASSREFYAGTALFRTSKIS